MTICVTSEGDTLNAAVDPRFGRCSHFIVVDPDTMDFKALENPASKAGGGAGIQAGQLMADESVEVVLTGNVGPNAFQTLSAAGVTVITGAAGSVRDAIEKYKAGELKAVDSATVKSHSGM